MIEVLTDCAETISSVDDGDLLWDVYQSIEEAADWFSESRLPGKEH